MAYGDRINAIKQDWHDDSLEMLCERAGDPGLELASLAKMTSNDLSNLHNALDTIKRKLATVTEALRPFAEFAEKAEQFVEARAEDGGSPIMPTKDFRLSDFRCAKSALAGTR